MSAASFRTPTGVGIDHLLQRPALHDPGRIALRDDAGEISYGAAARQANRLAAWLQAQGIRKGDRAAIILPNGIPFIVAELALLRAVGYTKADASAVVAAEHRFLLAAGLGIGSIAAAVAVVPAALRPGVHVPFGLLAFFLLGTLGLSLLWIRLATRAALRGDLVPALRQE